MQSRCGSTRDELDRKPDVHHIVPVRWFTNSGEHQKEDAHFLENVISLCIRCHRKADFGKITRDELWSLIGVEDPVFDS
ncbi:HNH endonuclease [Haloprofundus salilacus]|uniref:HNH endonuclease n=1 Tax=Haloprofundus salilacus TaxID=2876190 RepID=UPI001CCA920F